MRISSKASYVVAYSAFFMLFGIPSHDKNVVTAAVTEDNNIRTKVLLAGKIQTPSNMRAKRVGGVLSEEEKDNVELSPEYRKLLLQSDHGHDGAVSSDADDAGQGIDVATIHDVAMQRKLGESDNAHTLYDGISEIGTICSDDTSWRYSGNKEKTCGWVYSNPTKRCSKLSVDGVPASEGCPIACGDLRTKECKVPKCRDDAWFRWKPKYGGKWKVCNNFLWQHVKGRCRMQGVTTSDNKFFAYEYCNKCSAYGNSCVQSTPSPSLNPTLTPSSNPTSSTFETTEELRNTVSEYCESERPWHENPKYARYGPIEKWDISRISDMREVFSGHPYCNPEITHWDVSGVTSFAAMFINAQSFNQDISGWDVSNGENFRYMFMGASSFDQDLCGWDIDTSASMSDFCVDTISCGECF